MNSLLLLILNTLQKQATGVEAGQITLALLGAFLSLVLLTFLINRFYRWYTSDDEIIESRRRKTVNKLLHHKEPKVHEHYFGGMSLRSPNRR